MWASHVGLINLESKCSEMVIFLMNFPKLKPKTFYRYDHNINSNNSINIRGQKHVNLDRGNRK